MLVQLGLVCLLSQAVGVVLPPALLWGSELSDCTCMMNGHAMCPMHRPSRTRCAIRAAADDGTAMLAPLTIVAVLPVSSATSIAAPVAMVTGAFALDVLSVHPVAPDPPPPRA